MSLLAENVVSRDGKKLTNVMITHKVKEKHSPKFQEMKDYVRRVYASEGVETVDFENRFRTEYREKGIMPTLSSSDAHWGEHGHRMAAEELYSILFKSRSD